MRLTEQIESGQLKHNVETIGSKIAEYYLALKNRKEDDKLASFLKVMHLLVVKGRGEKEKEGMVKAVLAGFWKEFVTLGEPFTCLTCGKDDLKNKEEFKLTKYAPLCQPTILFLSRLIHSQDIQSEEVFETCLQIISHLYE